MGNSGNSFKKAFSKKALIWGYLPAFLIGLFFFILDWTIESFNISKLINDFFRFFISFLNQEVPLFIIILISLPLITFWILRKKSKSKEPEKKAPEQETKKILKTVKPSINTNNHHHKIKINEFELVLPGGFKLPLSCYKRPFGGQRLVSGLPLSMQGNVLDLGSGCGIIGLAAAKLGSNSVLMVDKISEECELARKNLALHGLKGRIMLNDYFQDIPEFVKKPFDWILSNPPELPSKEQWDIRECGGKTGWEHVDRVLEIAKDGLKQSGRLMLYVLNLLGITDPTGAHETLSSRANKKGFILEVIKEYKREIRFGNPAFREIRHITDTYPQAEFYAEKDGPNVLYGDDVIDHALKGRPVYFKTSVVMLKRLDNSRI